MVYNIKRAINILEIPELFAKLKNWKLLYKTKVFLYLKRSYFKLKNDIIENKLLFAAWKKVCPIVSVFKFSGVF